MSKKERDALRKQREEEKVCLLLLQCLFEIQL